MGKYEVLDDLYSKMFSKGSLGGVWKKWKKIIQ